MIPTIEELEGQLADAMAVQADKTKQLQQAQQERARAAAVVSDLAERLRLTKLLASGESLADKRFRADDE